jgi:hypothetical protein
MKTNDITVCAFPKSGITYFGFLLMAARLKHSGIDLRPTFYNIDFLLVDTHKFNRAYTPTPSRWRDGLGEFYKTHSTAAQFTAGQGGPESFNLIYLLRNPVDTLKSYYHFRSALGNTESIESFLAGPEGIAAWTRHVRSWLIENRNAAQSLYLLEYEKLIADPESELFQLARVLGLRWTTEDYAHALGMADIEVMRGNERIFAARNPVYRRFNLEFVRPKEARIVPQFTFHHVGLIQQQTQSLYDEVRSK